MAGPAARGEIGAGGPCLGASAPAARARSERFDEAALAALPDVLFRMRRDGTYLGYRAPEGAVLLVPPSEFIGRNVRDVLPSMAPALLACIERALESGGEECSEYTVHRADGPRVKEVRVVRAGADEAVAVVRDITALRRAEDERRALEARLREAQRLESLGLLAGRIAHRFNNLLVGILGNAALAQRDAPPGSRLDEALGRVRAAGEEASRLTAQLLAFSGAARFVVEPLDLARLVDEALPAIRAAVGGRTEVVAAHEGPAPTEADAAQVRAALTDAARCLAHACAGAASVTLRAGVVRTDERLVARLHAGGPLPPGPLAFVEVRADAPPALADLAALFEPPVLAGADLPTLAAAAGVMRAHGGGVLAEHDAGGGVRVTLLFPAAPDAAPRDLAPPQPPPRRPTVLVIDDEPLVREVTARALTQAGFRVQCAEGGPAALDLIESRPGDFDAALVDLQMPRLPGAQVLARLRETRPGIPVLLMSGYAREHFDAAQLRGAAGFIQKPFTVEALAAAVRSALRQSAPAPERAGAPAPAGAAA